MTEKYTYGGSKIARASNTILEHVALLEKKGKQKKDGESNRLSPVSVFCVWMQNG